jgi:signal transduction histidine kinase
MSIESKSRQIKRTKIQAEELLSRIEGGEELTQEEMKKFLKQTKTTLRDSSDLALSNYTDREEILEMIKLLGFYKVMDISAHEINSTQLSVNRLLSGVDKFTAGRIKEELANVFDYFRKLDGISPLNIFSSSEKKIEYIKRLGGRNVNVDIAEMGENTAPIPDGIAYPLKLVIYNAMKHGDSSEKVQVKYHKSIRGWSISNKASKESPITETMLDNMYKLGYQDKNAHGKGYGLFIAKLVAEDSGYEIRYDKDNEFGEGVTFLIGDKRAMKRREEKENSN